MHSISSVLQEANGEQQQSLWERWGAPRGRLQQGSSVWLPKNGHVASREEGGEALLTGKVNGLLGSPTPGVDPQVQAHG